MERNEEETTGGDTEDLGSLEKAADDPTAPVDGESQDDDGLAEEEEPVQGQQPG